MPTIRVESEVAGKVWKIEAKVGDALADEATILILESMKMEIPVLAPEPGRLADILVAEGDVVDEGQVLAVMDV